LIAQRLRKFSSETLDVVDFVAKQLAKLCTDLAQISYGAAFDVVAKPLEFPLEVVNLAS
jgi:hypothetical protein